MRRVLRDQPRKERLLKDIKDTSGGGERPTERAAGRTLTGWQQREYDAVCRAVSVTERMPDGQLRVRLIRTMYWGTRRYTLPGAAMVCHVSERTAQRWHGEFIRLAASYLGIAE